MRLQAATALTTRLARAAAAAAAAIYDLGADGFEHAANRVDGIGRAAAQDGGRFRIGIESLAMDRGIHKRHSALSQHAGAAARFLGIAWRLVDDDRSTSEALGKASSAEK